MSESPDFHSAALTWYVTSKPVALVWAVLFGLMGAGCVWAAITSATGGRERWGLIAFGELLVATAWASALRGIGDRPERRLAAGELDGTPAAVIRMSLTSPVAVVAFAGPLGALILGFGIDLGPGSGGWVFIVLGAFFVLLAGEGIRALTRRARLVMSPDLLEYHGWDYTASLPWESVLAAGPRTVKSRRFVQISGTSETGYRYRPLRRMFPLERRPEAPNIDVPVQALRSPEAYAALINGLAGVSREERAASIRNAFGGGHHHRSDG